MQALIDRSMTLDQGKIPSLQKYRKILLQHALLDAIASGFFNIQTIR
jgi:hypothetical protein